MDPLTIASIAIPAISGLISGKKKKKAEAQALRQQQEAEQAAIQRQEPFRLAGISALERYQTLLGIEPTQAPVQAQAQGQAADIAYANSREFQQEVNQIAWADPSIRDASGETDNYALQKAQDRARELLLKKRRDSQQAQQAAPQAPRKQSSTDILDIIRNTPGYQFAQQQGAQAAQRAASASGFGGSGNLAIELTDRASQLAQGTFQDYLSNLRQLIPGGQQAATAQAGSTQNIGAAQAGSTRRRSEIGSELLGDLTQIGGYALGKMVPPTPVAGTSLSGGTLNLSQFK